MKLSTKTILPIILISVLLILLNGCKLPTVPSPGYTPKDIIGKIETPKECCDTSKAHMPGWVPMVGATVILTDDSGKVTHTTTTEAEGKYQFTNVNPGLYVITAICPLNEEYLVKDVADKVAGDALNAGITDCQSTALALVVEYLLDIYDEDNECFGEGTDVYEQVKRVAAEYESLNLEGIDLAAIKAIKPEFDVDLVDLICYCLESCCTAPEPGFTPEPEPSGGTPPPYDPGPGPGPTVVYHYLTMKVSPTGGGSTTPGVGTYSYLAGTVVNISATAATCYDFVNWAGDVAVPNSASTTVIMNNHKTVTANFDLDPCCDNKAPTINSITPTTATVGEVYLGQVNATDDDGTITKYELISCPSGMIIDPDTGALSEWTPSCDDMPSVELIVKVTDNCGDFDQKSFYITVSSTNSPPDITSTPETTALVGTEYAYRIVATDTDCWHDITYSLVSGPCGMTFDDVDTINWTPSCDDIEGNPHSVTVRATDNGLPALYAEQTFTITVLTNNLYAPTITPKPFGRHAVRRYYNYYYTVVGSDDDDGDSVTYSLLPGGTGVPEFMDIDSNGKITWDYPICYFGTKCHICNTVKIIVRVTDNGCGELYYEQPLEIEIWVGDVDGNNPNPNCKLMTDGTIIY